MEAFIKTFLKVSLCLTFALTSACNGGGKNPNSHSSGSTPGNFEFNPATSLSQETRNNTSASDRFPNVWPYKNGNSFGNVSRVDLHKLLYQGSATKITTHLMGWFGRTGHKDVGYKSDDRAQILKQLDDMTARGINGVWIDWYGPGSQEDTIAKILLQESGNRGGQFKVGIVIDKGTIDCPNISATDCMINRINYVASNFGADPNYPKTSNGNPIISFFLKYPDYDWNSILPKIAKNARLVFENKDAFTDLGDYGAYTWVFPTASDFGLPKLDEFYNISIGYLGQKHVIGAVYKGFNDAPAGWTMHRIMSQRCGRTWLDTFDVINKHFHMGQQLPELQLVTWNDYEEGTELETGIYNCLGSIDVALSGDKLSWRPVFNDQNGTEETIDHYEVFVTTDMTAADPRLMLLGKTGHGEKSFDLAGAGLPQGSYRFFVKAVGAPFILNQMSQATSMNVNAKAPQSAQSAQAMAVAAPGSLNTGGVEILSPLDNTKFPSRQIRLTAHARSQAPITRMTVFVDGLVSMTAAAADIDKPLTLPPGAHELRVNAWDTDSNVFTASRVVLVQGVTAQTKLEGQWKAANVTCSGGTRPNTAFLDLGTDKPTLTLTRDRGEISVPFGSNCVISLKGQVSPSSHTFSAANTTVDYSAGCARDQFPQANLTFKKRFTVNGNVLKTFESPTYTGGVCPLGEVETQVFVEAK